METFQNQKVRPLLFMTCGLADQFFGWLMASQLSQFSHSIIGWLAIQYKDQLSLTNLCNALHHGERAPNK